ncbi:DMT family transporter [Burkholderiaceae bacterium FT117]|uniref:DMT family transporter n=1 Tax=Zeimonas sediminis TaxID=2944268 RepID=UPI00234314B5|nr:DMT family transporter [Zeimonas sediminis]MCM5570275.1 DMT family transporter [Zeimonas sediminis]
MSHSIRLGPRDLALLALLTLIWGVNWPVMKIGVQELPPMTFRSLCMIGGLPTLALIARSRGLSLRVPAEHRAELLVLALTNMVLWFVFAMYGVKLLSSGRAAILGYTMPIWSAVVGILVFGEHPSRRLWVGVAAAAAGVALLLASEFTAIAGSPLGTLSMLTAAVIWAYGTHRMRRRVQPTHLLVITFWSLSLGLLVCGTIALVFESDQLHRLPNAAEWGAIAFNAFLVFGLAQLLWFRLATILPPVASGLSVMLIPVTGVFSGVWMLGERLLWQDWAALACILAAIATVLMPTRKSASGA